jgi:hypothetical protein
MTQTNETRRALGAAGLGDNAFPDGEYNSKNAPKLAITQGEIAPAPEQFAPEPFPSFLQLVAQNAEGPMRRAAAYLRICEELASVDDSEGYCESCDKFLDAGREIAKLRSLLKIPTIFSNELADRLEEKALTLHELADLTEMQASRIRQVVTL